MRTSDRLIDILTRQSVLYIKVEFIEAEKSKAISMRDGKILESLVKEQELYISEVDQLEMDRSECMTFLAQELNEGRTIRTLTHAASLIGTHSADALLAIGRNLKDSMLRIKRISRINEKCMQDNLEFFTIIVDSIRDSTRCESGYAQTGKTLHSSAGSSIIFNQTV